MQPIRLRRLTIEDFAAVLKWSKDPLFCAANEWKNRSDDEVYRWWLRCVDIQAEDFIRMGIEYDERLIGYADMASIHNHTAELGIAIGESSLWGQGIGTKAAICMMEYGATQYGITVFTAETRQDNFRAQKMLEKIGFEEVSRLNAFIQYRLDFKGKTTSDR